MEVASGGMHKGGGSPSCGGSRLVLAAWGEPSRPGFPPEGETGKGESKIPCCRRQLRTRYACIRPLASAPGESLQPLESRQPHFLKRVKAASLLAATDRAPPGPPILKIPSKTDVHWRFLLTADCSMSDFSLRQSCTIAQKPFRVDATGFEGNGAQRSASVEGSCHHEVRVQEVVWPSLSRTLPKLGINADTFYSMSVKKSEIGLASTLKEFGGRKCEVLDVEPLTDEGHPIRRKRFTAFSGPAGHDPG